MHKPCTVCYKGTKESYYKKIMLRKIDFKRTPSSLKKYKKQKKYCSKSYEKEHKVYFDKINPKKSLITKVFEKICNLYSQKIEQLGTR